MVDGRYTATLKIIQGWTLECWNSSFARFNLANKNDTRLGVAFFDLVKLN